MTSGVCPPLCGESTTLGRARNGSPGFNGSSWKTSSPAPAILFCVSASSSASRSTSAPRPVLIRIAVGYIIANSRRPRNPRVSGPSRKWSEMTSARRQMSSFDAARAPSAATAAASPRAL